MVVDSIPGNCLLSTTKYFTITTHCMIVLMNDLTKHDDLTKPRGAFGLRKTTLLLICVRSLNSDVDKPLKNMITSQKRSYATGK